MQSRNKATGKIKNVLSGLLFDVMTNIPDSLLEPVENPDERVKNLIQSASLRAATVSTTLSIPAGITGILVAVPDVLSVWKIQAQLVSDIAATYGKIAILNKTSMMFCLFKHSTAHLLKDFVLRSGPRYIVHKLSNEAFEKAVQKISIHFSSRFLRRIVTKAVPAIGAVSNGALSYWDTKQVGKTAQAYFKSH